MKERSRPRILVVDDDPALRDLLSLVLEKQFAVVTAPNGEAAYTLATGQEFDAAVIDLMLPGVSGIKLCQDLRATDRTRNLPILLLTAKSQPEDKREGYEAGANDYVTKPFSIDDLRYRLELLIARESRLRLCERE